LVGADDGWLVHGLDGWEAELNWGRRTVVRGVGEASNLWCPMVVRRVAHCGHICRRICEGPSTTVVAILHAYGITLLVATHGTSWIVVSVAGDPTSRSRSNVLPATLHFVPQLRRCSGNSASNHLSLPAPPAFLTPPATVVAPTGRMQLPAAPQPVSRA
jgi:hypothetical protein